MEMSLKLNDQKILISKNKWTFLFFFKKRENLIEKTVKELERFYQREFLVSIDLKKNLPISSGMGGGILKFCDSHKVYKGNFWSQ